MLTLNSILKAQRQITAFGQSGPHQFGAEPRTPPAEKQEAAPLPEKIPPPPTKA